jgi:hypothetical protein
VWSLCVILSNFGPEMSTGLAPDSVLIYVDNCLVMARSPQEIMERLGQVFDRFRAANLRMHPSKCNFTLV